MDPFAHSNYHYPRSANEARLCVSEPPQKSLQHVAQGMDPSLNQAHSGNGYMYPDSSDTTHVLPSLDFMASYDPYTQRNIAPTGSQGVVHPDPVGPMTMYYMGGSSNLSDQYIPSSSDRITCTDHRPLDEIFGNIRTAPRWPHPKSNLVHPSHIGTPRGHPAHASVLSYPLPPKSQIDGSIQIPLPAVDSKISGAGLVVNFQCSAWGIGTRIEGIPMSDLLCGNISTLENPYQRVLDGLGLTDLRFNIFWPHHPPFAKVLSAFGRDGKPITRAELGYEVSLAFADFFRQLTSHSNPTKPGPYIISSSYLGTSSPAIRFDQLHLISVRTSSRGEWVAEIRAISKY